MKSPCHPVVSAVVLMAGLSQTVSAASFQINGVEPIAAVRGESPPAMTAGFTVIAPGSTPDWTASLEGSPPWASLNAASGSGAGSVTITFNSSTLSAGTYSTALSLNSGGVISRQPFTLTVITPNVVKMEADHNRPVIYALHRGTQAVNPPGYVIFLNTATEQVDLVLPAGTSPADMDISYHEDKLYVSNHGVAAGSIRVIDLTTRREVRAMNSDGDANIYKINAGRSGRIVTEGQSQWVSVSLLNSANAGFITSAFLREGDGEFDPSGRYYYHCSNNLPEADLIRFDTAADLFTYGPVSPIRAQGSRNLVMSGDGSRLYWQTYAYDADLNELRTYGTQIYASTFHGEIVFSSVRAYNGQTGAQLSQLPVTTTVMAVSGDQQKLFLFNASTGSFTRQPMSAIAPAPVPGVNAQPPDNSVQLTPLAQLSWDAVSAAIKYRVFYGSNEAAVAGATVTSPEYAGETTNNSWPLPAGTPAPGETLYWRVDYAGLAVTTPGPVRSFRASPATVNPVQVDVRMIRGAPPVSVRLPVTGIPGTTWTAETGGTAWLRVVTPSGVVGDTLELELAAGSLAAGSYTGTVTFTTGEASLPIPVRFGIETASYVSLLADPVRPVLYALQRPATLAGSVAVISTVTGAVQRVIPVSSNPRAFDITPDGEFLYVIAIGQRKMHRINLTDWTVAERVLGPSSDAPLSAGRYRVAAGAGTKVYWVDADTQPLLHTMDFATGAETGSPARVDTNMGYGDLAWIDGGASLAGWSQDGWSTGTGLSRSLMISGTGTSAALEYAAVPMPRDPLNTPVLPRPDGTVFMKRFKLAAGVQSVLKEYPAEIYAVTPGPGIVFGAREAWREKSLTRVWQAPAGVDASISAVAGDSTAFFFFNAAAATLVRVPMSTISDLPGPSPEPGEVVSAMPASLSWTPHPQGVRYEVYFGTDPSGVAGAEGQASPFHLGSTPQPSISLAVPFRPAGTWWWRVDVVLPGSTVRGTVWQFSGAVSYVAHLVGEIQYDNGGIPAPSLAVAGDMVMCGYPNGAFGNPGIVRVYRRQAGTEAWSLHQRMERPAGASADAQFGSAIAIKGSTAWIGARYDRTVGKAYEYGLNASTDRWEPTGRSVQSSTAVGGEGFGDRLAFDGTVLAVGIPGVSEGNPLTGAVELFDTLSLSRIIRMTPQTPRAMAQYGQVMTLGGGFLAITNPQSSGAAGDVEIWTRGASAWTRTTTLNQNARGFGNALAVTGNTLLVAAPSDVAGSPGRVFEWRRNAGGTWLLTSQFSAAGPARADVYGVSLAASGEHFVMGTPTRNFSANYSGAAWLHRRVGDAWMPVAPAVTGFSPDPSPRFGEVVAMGTRYMAVAWPGNSSDFGVSVFLYNPDGNVRPAFITNPPSFTEEQSHFRYSITVADENAGDELAITTASALPAWLQLADNGDRTAVLEGTPPAGSAGNVSITIAVEDQAGEATRQSFTLTILPAGGLPRITGTSGSQVSDDGKRVEFSVTVAPGGPASTQWYYNGALLPGQTGSSLVIDRVQASDAGAYQVRVTRGTAWVDSDPLQLTVNQVADRFGGDWPTMGASSSHAGTYPATLSRHKFLPAWTAAAAGNNQVATGGGLVYATSGGGYDVPGVLSAYSLQSGQKLWATSMPPGVSINPPTYHRGRVYMQRGRNLTSSSPPDLRCFDAATGALQWTAPFGAQGEAYMAPAVDDTGIYINGGEHGGLYRFGLDGSEIFFSRRLEQVDRWTPLLHQGNLYSWVDSNFRRHDPGSGAEISRITVPGNNSPTFTVPAAEGNTAVMRTDDTLIAVDLAANRIRWQLQKYTVGSPAIRNGIVYAIGENAVASYDAVTGAAGQVYSTMTGPGMSNTGSHQPIVLDDTLIVSSETSVGTTWVFDRATGARLDLLTGGGPLTYTDGFLLAAGGDGTLRAWKVNQPAVITPPAAELAATEDVLFTWDIAVSDPDADALAVSFSGLPAWLTAGPLENGILRLTGTPLHYHTGPLAFTITVNDSKSFPAVLTISGTVTAVNDAPLAAAIAPVTVDEDSLVPARSLLTVFSDEEDRFTDLTIRIAGNTNPALFSRVLLFGPNLLLTAAPDASGSAVLTLEATDSGGLKVEAQYAVTVNSVPDAPRLAPNPPPLSIPADGSPFAYPVAALFTDPDPGEVLTYSLVHVDRPELFRALAVDAATGRLDADWKPHVWGSAIITVRATGIDGLLLDTTLTVSLPEPPAPQWNLTGAAVINRQTGLVEQRITLTNTAPRPIAGFELWLSTGNATALYNGISASSPPGGTAPPAPWLLPYVRPLAAGEAVTVVLEFYNPRRAAEFTITAANALDPLAPAYTPPAAQGAPFAITRALPVPGGVLVEFPSEPGAGYRIEYSGDNQSWSICPLPLKAGGTRVQWIDRGPPFTGSAPDSVSQRFYRVRRL